MDDSYLDHQGLGAGPLRGVDGFAFVVRTNFAAYRDLDVRIEDLFASGDRVAARITWEGHRTNDEHVVRRTIDIRRIENGRAFSIGAPLFDRCMSLLGADPTAYYRRVDAGLTPVDGQASKALDHRRAQASSGCSESPSSRPSLVRS